MVGDWGVKSFSGHLDGVGNKLLVMSLVILFLLTDQEVLGWGIHQISNLAAGAEDEGLVRKVNIGRIEMIVMVDGKTVIGLMVGSKVALEIVIVEGGINLVEGAEDEVPMRKIHFTGTKISDGFGGCAGIQSWSVGNSGWSKWVGSASEAGGASSLGKGKDEIYATLLLSDGVMQLVLGEQSPRAPEKMEMDGKLILNFDEIVNGIMLLLPVEQAPQAKEKKKANQLGNAAGSWGTSSLSKGKDESE
ncbi:hypothetical protein NE237_008884 [Protea cynaroides]|uniref:Uncharacterized protein n=1 Tax=Protea cynaroides TaxID=273540 RepID=A0A9Q0R041_9MAGN|nr:hypothetical protein NE237_008884 [Protea cynaroides]